VVASGIRASDLPH